MTRPFPYQPPLPLISVPLPNLAALSSIPMQDLREMHHTRTQPLIHTQSQNGMENVANVAFNCHGFVG